ncbi:MBL fold metallo-hydrolase [Aquibacillus koreensis]|uniref:MBL fold metallo-hydrolase n=1 Tax=Aquibacillus koreensis TaxID=279446 RepID=A0A9X3WHL1_9BACI|nr:MBL fold metallo-hydrolase [Aquibacillus koreensis]MCT2537120.1 MBL fold metallo-hydrolase [Aquibacillus koreensis]MDC3419897.1 MBL fold metallo-hydrolase [Aquibacillus koreensis]
MENQLTFFGGLDTVGGVQIVFGKGNTGLLFDAGIQHGGLFNAPFIHLNDPMSKPIHGRELRQYLLTRMAPPLLHLYDSSLLGSLDEADLQRVWPEVKLPSYTNLFVFISHIHQDHIALLPFLDKSVTVFMHEDAYSSYEALISAGYYSSTEATIQTFMDGQHISLGDFSIQTVEMDHNASGTSGFILTADSDTLAFTADWRTQGRHPGRIEKFIDACRAKQVNVLITETTRVNKQSLFNVEIDRQEDTVMRDYSQIIEHAPGLVYLNALPIDLERTADIISRTKAVGKTLVMEKNIATFWHEAIINGISILEGHPAITDMTTIKVLESIDSLPYSTITIDEIVQNKQQYVIVLSYKSIAYMTEFEQLGDKLPSTFIHADAPANQQVVQKWLQAFGVEYRNISNKGHASHQNVSKLVERIQPNVVIPVHGLVPSLLQVRGVAKYFPEYGETVTLNQLLSNQHKARI